MPTLNWWGLTRVGYWSPPNPLYPPPWHPLTSKINLYWVRGPRFEPIWLTCERSQMPQQKEPWHCWTGPAPFTYWENGRRGSLGAAKIPGDGRLGQCPSGEFIKDDELFCGCCLPQDMNVIRAQLKGQGCTFKCHWTLQGPNVPLTERLTGAPSTPLTLHIRGSGKCAEVFVSLSQQWLGRKIFVLKISLWRCLNEY